MATKQQTVDYLVEQMAAAGEVSGRKMFGEYALYCDGKMVASVCDDRLFVKPTAAGRALLGEPYEAPPYPGAKPHFEILGDRWDEADWLSAVIRATAEELPAPVPKKKRAAR